MLESDVSVWFVWDSYDLHNGWMKARVSTISSMPRKINNDRIISSITCQCVYKCFLLIPPSMLFLTNLLLLFTIGSWYSSMYINISVNISNGYEKYYSSNWDVHSSAIRSYWTFTVELVEKQCTFKHRLARNTRNNSFIINFDCHCTSHEWNT